MDLTNLIPFFQREDKTYMLLEGDKETPVTIKKDGEVMKLDSDGVFPFVIDIDKPIHTEVKDKNSFDQIASNLTFKAEIHISDEQRVEFNERVAEMRDRLNNFSNGTRNKGE